MPYESYIYRFANYHMMIEEVLRKFNPWWHKEYVSPGIPRNSYHLEVEKLFRRERILILFGLRRVGKTTIMKQLIAKYLKEMNHDRIFFAGIDHPELERTPLQELLREFRRINGLKSNQEVILFLDEVQSRSGFEKELKGIYDLEKSVKIIASGSSSLVIKQKSSHLIGRYRSIKVKPLSFQEYLAFKDETPDRSEPQLMEKMADHYLLEGGMPEYVLSSDPGYITELVTNIIYRDICTSYGVKDPKLLKDLYFLLMQRVGKRISYSKLARLLDIGDDAIKRYIGYFEEAFLLHVIEQEGTPNERKYGQKKCYSPDNGICSVISGSSASGPLAENCVYLNLREDCEPRYYNKKGIEVDFLCKKRAYEVKYKAKLAENDLIGFSRFRKKGLNEKWMITRSERSKKGKIKKVPFWEFLLER